MAAQQKDQCRMTVELLRLPFPNQIIRPLALAGHCLMLLQRALCFFPAVGLAGRLGLAVVTLLPLNCKRDSLLVGRQRSVVFGRGQ